MSVRAQLTAIRQTVALIRGLRAEMEEATAPMDILRLHGRIHRHEADVMARLERLEAGGALIAVEAMLPLCLGGAPAKEAQHG